MDRRKNVSDESIMIAKKMPKVFKKDLSGGIQWFIVNADPAKHGQFNHIYTIANLLHEVDYSLTYRRKVFTIGGNQLSFAKIYECIIDDKYPVWCRPADYKLLDEMKKNRVMEISVVCGLASPFNLKSYNKVLPVDGYEVHFLYE